ncbi:unnamed protein product [Cuscuta epithymum]|uniref:C2 NT-type domain-containing protein n=1 Tax=Cuscuta epithymum TaxID=186058 RepID=A0AAV0GAN9_9ASTE|nr:unnamed protein product [Cuscuta epithymum]CAH9144334.1 unnamed protein product [Cuscuta epithymum]
MFKSARWRSEKVKIKAVFKLQFRATKVAAGDALLISVVPADVGKPTVKLEKAKVQDGSCFWENAVYETMKLTRDPKSGKIHERIYNFVVATGSLKSGIVGEATIDFSSYAEATKVSSVSLPLKNSKSGVVLHVSIQRIHDSFSQSVNHESETVKPDAEDKTLKEKLNEDMDDCYEDNPVNETQINRNLSLVGPMNVGRTSSESDITLSSSDSSSGLDTPHAFEAINNNGLKVQNSLLLSSPNNALSQRSQCEWLTRQAEVCDLELQTLRKQIIKESKRSQDLSREIVIVIEERDALKEECEKLKASRRRLDDAKCKDELLDGRDVHTLVHELRQELNYHKDLNANLQIRLEKTQESNSELILAVRDLEELLEHKDKEITKLSSNSENISRICLEPGKCVSGNTSYKDDGDEEQKALEQLVRHHGDGIESYELEQKIMDLENELEIYRRDKDELEIQMEQLALDYEILKQENHHLLHKLEQSQLQEQLNMQCECSSGSYAQIEALEEELEKRAQQFETDLEALSNAKVEQEKRAICAEEELRKTRLQNAKTAEKLQKELKRLSVQIASTFQANEKLATKALTESNELRLEKSQLENELVSMHKKVEECIEGMNNMARLMNEKDTLVAALRLEIGALREQYSELNSRMSEDELEKDKLREEVSKLKSDLKKKEDTLRACSRKDKCALASHEVTSLKEKIKLLEGQIKMKENALETSTNSYLEKEKDHQNKIEELETRIEELNQNNASLCEHMSQKEGTEDFDLISGTSETRNSNNELWDEVRLLRERKGIMEAELKEMQERYSEISLKFAEVEGERQQLVMKVRNLKSAKKSP